MGSNSVYQIKGEIYTCQTKKQHCSEIKEKQSDSILSVYYLQLLKILQFILLTGNAGLSAYLSACSISDNVTVCSFGY